MSNRAEVEVFRAKAEETEVNGKHTKDRRLKAIMLLAFRVLWRGLWCGKDKGLAVSNDRPALVWFGLYYALLLRVVLLV